MKKLLLLLLFIPIISIAQNDPTTISYKITNIQDNCYKVEVEVKIEKGWHIYALNQPKDAICLPLKLKCKGNNLQETLYEEIGVKKKQHIEVLDVNQYYYSDSVKLVKRILVGKERPYHFILSVEYQACTDEQCLPVNSKYFHITLE